MKTFLILAGLIFLTACGGQDTTGDVTQRDMDRQNSAADHIELQYSKLKGQFSGTYNQSYILLTLDVARETSTGNGDLGLVPLPHLVGNLTLTPEIFVIQGGQPLNIPYSITDGQYVGGNDLSLVVQEDGSPTTLHCKVTDADLSHLDCDWYMNASSAPRAVFSLDRTQPGESLHAAQSKSFVGRYTGKNADYSKILATFDTFLEPQTGSLAVPQVTIAGKFVFYPKPTAAQIAAHEDPGFASFPFTDSEYDPISNTMVIKINGDNPIEVNCAIQSVSTLNCVWIGFHGTNSNEEFTLVKSAVK